jgi:hypothetical protein
VPSTTRLAVQARLTLISRTERCPQRGRAADRARGRPGNAREQLSPAGHLGRFGSVVALLTPTQSADKNAATVTLTRA